MTSSTYVLYQYTPSLVAAMVFAILFFLTTTVHLWQRIRNHTQYFNPFIVGVQIIGYGARAVSHFHTTSTTLYALQTLLVLLAPTLYAASIYRVLGRVIKFLRGEHLSYVPVKYMTIIFVMGDLLSFILQGAGGGVMSSSGSADLLVVGQWIIVAGLCVQLVFFGAFIITSICFHCRITQSPTQEAKDSINISGLFSRDWRGLLFALYTASVLILIRSIYRIIEFAQGNSGYVISHEVFLYVFDASMMFLVMIVMNLYHPSVVLCSSESPISSEIKMTRTESDGAIYSDRDIKCDETKPSCNNCVRHEIECDFNKQTPVTGTLEIGSIASRSTKDSNAKASPSVIAPSPSTEALNPNASPSAITAGTNLPGSNLTLNAYAGGTIGIAEMELLHHYSTSTCYTISRLPILQTVWRIRVPKFGFSSPFLLHGILSLSALHLAYLKPEQHAQYVTQAEFHHNLALKMVSATLPMLDEENAAAIYLFSTITSIISCAKPRQSNDFWVIGDRDIEWLSLFRGTRWIIASAEETIKTGALAPIFTNGARRSVARNARSTIRLTYLDDLRNLLKDHVADFHELDVYFSAIEDLSKSFATLEEEGIQNCQTADVFVWLLQISDEYLQLLRQRKPEALVVFSYFCVITHALEWMWWMQGLSIHLIRGIYYFLDEEYRCWLQWPMEQLGWVP
ncbi:hypothetical protein N7528_009237 [Penicillium herquei]|nr:hypothetical protein N7528_009237 [Penicillium herquei]